jgi:outer membrane protein assembly factor BamB
MHSPLKTAVGISLALCAVLESPAGADDWPHWRGPRFDGVSRESGWLDRWPEGGPPIAWRASVATGFSSFSVKEDRLYTMGNAEDADTVWCLNAGTGDTVWKHTYPAPLDPNLFEGGPTSTPTIAADSVYTFSRRGDVFCLDAASGAARWSTSIVEGTGVPLPAWGFASSPLVTDRFVVLNAGAAGMALDRGTGKVAWQSDAEEGAYATPVPFLSEGGRLCALIVSATTLSAVNVDDGSRRWHYRWLTRFGVNAADPIVAGRRVFISSGYGKGAALIEPGDGEPKTLWKSRELRTQINPAVLIDGFLYGVHGDTTDVAALRCLELATGAVRWEHEEIGSGSVIAADGKLIVLTDTGELIVAPASQEGFQPSARARVLDGKCWTTPVLANGRIYCRNAAGDIVCVDVRPQPVP